MSPNPTHEAISWLQYIYIFLFMMNHTRDIDIYMFLPNRNSISKFFNCFEIFRRNTLIRAFIWLAELVISFRFIVCFYRIYSISSLRWCWLYYVYRLAKRNRRAEFKLLAILLRLLSHNAFGEGLSPSLLYPLPSYVLNNRVDKTTSNFWNDFKHYI